MIKIKVIFNVVLIINIIIIVIVILCTRLFVCSYSYDYFTSDTVSIFKHRHRRVLLKRLSVSNYLFSVPIK